MKGRFAHYIAILGLLVGCSRVPLADEGVVSWDVARRIDSQVKWCRSCNQDDDAVAFIQQALSCELTADSAIQIALLNNPKIQATFEELGIARADLLEAGLLSNPSFALEVRYPSVSSLRTNIEYLITSSLLDIFLIPLRSKLAEIEYEQTKLRVSNAILDVAFDVRETYYLLVAEKKRVGDTRLLVELARIQRDIASKQAAVGNVNTLEFQLIQSRYLEAELELSESETTVIRLSEELYRLLGFAEDPCLLLPEYLEEVDYCSFDLCTLETIALEERLDLQIARFEIMRLARQLELKEWWTYTDLRAGLAGERDPDGTNLIGPGFSGEIPIFNYGQAARMRLLAQLRQAQQHLAGLEIQVLSEVRRAHKLLVRYANILSDYQTHFLPMQHKITTSSEGLYNVMGLGIDKLLESKRQQILACRSYMEIRKKYLVTRVELERALGGRFF